VTGFEVVGRKCTIFCRPPLAGGGSTRVLTLLKIGDDDDEDEHFADVAESLATGNLAACGMTELEVLDLLTREIGPDDYDLLLKLDETNRRKVVAGDVLDNFATVVVGEGEEHGCVGESCRVCLVQFEDAEVVRCLPCNHLFHDECIRQWLTSWKNTCPLCGVELGIEAEHSDS
jgi:hypothetical protein